MSEPATNQQLKMFAIVVYEPPQPCKFYHYQSIITKHNHALTIHLQLLQLAAAGTHMHEGMNIGRENTYSHT